jgi:hypothetical protein
MEHSDANVFLKATLARVEPNLEEIALTAGTSLGAAAARGFTDMAITGSDTSETMFLTTKESDVMLPIYDATWNDPKRRWEINDRVSLNMTASRYCAAVNGVLVESMSGQSSAPLAHLVTKANGGTGRSCAMELTYPNWPAIGAVVGVCDAHITDKNGTPVNVHFPTDKEIDERHLKASGVLEGIYKQSWKTRMQAVYPDAPRLTKSVMRVPTGIDFSSFDAASNVVDKPFCFSAETFEAIMASMLRVELGFDDGEIAKITNTAKATADTPGVLEGMDAAVYAPNWASALSSAAGFVIPYRADGRTALLPTGLKTFSAESWLAEAGRAPFAADDCDGSAAFVTSAVAFVNNLFETTGVDLASNRAKYPHLFAMYRALVHFEPSVAVLGANAAHAGDSGKGSMKDKAHPKKQIAGHAMVILIPKLQLLTALYEGSQLILPDGKDIRTAKKINSRPVLDQDAKIDAEALAQERLDAFYPQTAIIPLPQRERQELLGASWTDVYAKLKDGSSRFASLKPLAVEGTAPADSRLHTPTVTAEGRRDFETRHKMGLFERKVAKRLSPSIASVTKTLDSGDDNKHGFYSAFVELVFSLKTPLFTKSSVQRAGQATAHVALVNLNASDSSMVGDAGVTPEDLHCGIFAAVPLWKLGTNDAATMASASAEVRANTLPRRRVPVRLHAHQSDTFADACVQLEEIETILKENEPAANGEHVNVILSYSSLVHNPQSVTVLKEMLRSIKGVSGHVDRAPIPGLAVHATGDTATHEAGLLVTLDLLVPRDFD